MPFAQTLKFRLFCESCTGIAGYGPEPVDGGSKTCQNCGHQTPVKKENWIALTDSEQKRVNIQQSVKEEPIQTKKK